ncbi:MAG TPA: hypothetical protein VNZ52_17005 [Candidatus Thermoplasmatota archaeon]|nr:hypothetical protein [Candidatus Thermoplasmatota archaeon]
MTAAVSNLGHPTLIDLAGLENLTTRCIALLAGRGSGKTTSLEAMTEAPCRVLAVDPVGELARRIEHREDVSLVKVPLDWRDRPKLIPRILEALRASARSRVVVVVPPGLYADTGPFVDALCQALLDALESGGLRDVVCLFEECQRYLGQSREGTSYAAIALVEMGRNWSCGVVMATQRPASAHKEALARADTFFVGRLYYPHDLNAVSDLLEAKVPDKVQRARLIQALPDMPTGHFLLSEPAHLPGANTP